MPVSRRRIGTGWISGHQSATPAAKNETCSSRWTSGVLDGRVVERGDVPEVHQRQPRDDPGGRARERAEPALERRSGAASRGA